MNCTVIIKSLYPAMHEGEKRIADFILKQSENIINMTVAQISREIGVADSSIVRFCKKLGFNGFTQLKINLAKNIQKSEESILQDINKKDSPYIIASKVFDSSIKALKDSSDMLDERELDKAVNALISAKRIEFYGVGTSATIAMDAYYRFMRIGLPAYAAIDSHISKVSANMLDKDCVAVGISHTGRTKETINTLKIAKDKGAKVICCTSFLDSPITDIADIKLITSTVETKFMKEAVVSRIAQIVLLDSLYTCIVAKKYNMASKNLDNMGEILNNMRL
nr:MurR/RpiR family transcriptional regulator [Clostridium ganghwense]